MADDQQDDSGMAMLSEDEEMDDRVLPADEEDEGHDDEIVDLAEEQRRYGSRRVYLPQPTDDKNGPLECDESAYVFLHEFTTGSPCLSFDILEDELGAGDRAKNFPISMSLVAGTQTDGKRSNNLIVMKMSNVQPTKGNAGLPVKDDDDESSDEDEDSKPELETATIHHPGCVNRIRFTMLGGKPIVATWSDIGKVYIWDVTYPLKAVNDPYVMTNYVRNNVEQKPIYCFSGHLKEGYALAWSKFSPGVMASGDSNKDIHLWKPLESGGWHVNQRSYTGHKGSVEDLQWSPTEDNVLASCSTDKSIRIWDIRAAPDKACMLTKKKAHESDVNVIHWNKFDPLILSGGDDGKIQIWDLRKFPASPPVCIFKHHTAPITSVEWHPTDSTVFAASGEDDQVTLWDIAVEKDAEAASAEEEAASPELAALPPQLLFIHQGQKEIKELHWHPQMPGVALSTAASGFNVFRTVSI